MANNLSSCGFQGNVDIYGLGIRLGLYLNWMSGLLALHLLPETVPELLDLSFIYELAIFIATIVLHRSSTNAVEIFILLSIYFGNLYTVSFPALIAGMDVNAFSASGDLVRAAFPLAMSAYALWFWFSGYYGFEASPCGSYGFLFVKISLTGAARHAFQAFALVHLIIKGVTFILAMFVHSASFWMSILLWTDCRTKSCPTYLSVPEIRKISPWEWFITIITIWQTPLAEHYTELELKKKASPFSSRHQRVVSYAAIVLVFLMVISIELTLHWNSVSRVYPISSTGQLIPLIMGICSVWKVLNERLAGGMGTRPRAQKEAYNEWIAKSQPNVHSDERKRAKSETSTRDPSQKLHGSEEIEGNRANMKDVEENFMAKTI